MQDELECQTELVETLRNHISMAMGMGDREKVELLEMVQQSNLLKDQAMEVTRDPGPSQRPSL